MSQQEQEQVVASLDNVLNKIKEIDQNSSKYTMADQTSISKLNRRMAEWMNNNTAASSLFPEIQSLVGQNQLGISIDELKSISAAFDDIIAKANEARMTGKSFGDALSGSFRNLARYMMSFASVYRVIGTLKQAVNIVKEMDTGLTEMRKVSNESLDTLKQYQMTTFDSADQVGTTAKQLQQSTADWMRLGETLDEAKQSAKESNILLNVSEFQNIDAATESLVAMSQAYKELDKIDIIDKLNNIGNNFSISTNELAQSLQKSAGTLKVTGDTLDEAIALTVAGNQVLQNPDIVGQSLKTISLRLSGTSVQDMQEAGEEVDGLITTQSKLRQTILDATKVASNNYKGFDILNDDGTYKTTYERMLGIAKVFKEIGEEDKKFGTNRQSFLLETVAGLKKPVKYGNIFLSTHLNALII